MILDVEAEQVVAEQSVQDVLAPRADAERFAVRPRNVPELADGHVGPRFLDESRQQREVIVLHEDDGAVVADLLDHGVGESPIHPHVLLPIALRRIQGARRRCGRAATARCWRSRSSSPALLPASARLAAACMTGDRAGRAHDRCASVDFAIGAAAAVCDPGTAAGAHHRVERGDQAACRPHPFNSLDVPCCPRIQSHSPRAFRVASHM